VIAVDTSVLCHAVNRYAPEHRRASGVMEALVHGERPWALPWPALHEFLRLVTHPHAVARPLRAGNAMDFIGRLLESPSVRPLAATPRHARTLAEVVKMMGPGAPLAPGIEIAAILREHGVRELLSEDKGMRRFPFLAVTDPLHGEEWTPESGPARRYRVLRGYR
jgi:toxin-antitoxin system PIN domain toxin